ncbi:pepsin-like aspartic protease [Rhodotorula paludigena]|uniref:pepsin-like aspartic protease n=1 Tax=Rhodotorula paludigena TaxID=86838 RepID=UPI003172A1BB
MLGAIVLFALAGSAAATAAIPHSDATIELTRRDLGLTNLDGSANITSLLAEASRLAHKYERNRLNWDTYSAMNEKGPTAKKMKKRGTAALTEQSHAVWTGKVNVGTPAQTFDVYFDTGSSDFTLSSPSCTANCNGKAHYAPADSSTSVRTGQTVSTNFVDGTTSRGAVFKDTVTLAGTTVTGQDVVAASSLSSTVGELESDGMGLAYPSLSAAGSTSFGLTMVQQKQYALYPYFSMMLSYGGRSEITFGGFNRARVLSGSSSYWFNATPDPNGVRTYWQMGLSVPYVGNTRAGGYTTHILDSGTTLIVTSPAQAAEFWAAVPGSAKYDDNFWSFPCASPPDVKFSFSRNTVFKYGVDQDAFNLGYLSSSPDRCIGAVIGQDLGIGTSWILGDAFLVNWYVIHDALKNRIMLAQLRPGANA